MFIVTGAGLNLELGDSEVLLVEKAEMLRCLSDSTSKLRLQRAAIAENLRIAEASLETAQRLKKQAALRYDIIAPANASEINVRSNIENITAEIDTLTARLRYWDSDEAKAAFWRTSPVKGFAPSPIPRSGGPTFVPSPVRPETGRYFDWKAFGQARTDGMAIISQQIADKRTEKAHLEARKVDLAEAANPPYLNNIKAADAECSKARNTCEALRKDLKDLPSPAQYLQKLAPHFDKRVFTDAHGQFTITCSRHKTFAIFAKGQRPALAEEYCWILDAPNTAQKTKVLLSGNNMISNDPDHYLSLAF